MPLTQSEREWIELKARDIAFAVCEKVCEKVLEVAINAIEYEICQAMKLAEKKGNDGNRSGKF